MNSDLPDIYSVTEDTAESFKKINHDFIRDDSFIITLKTTPAHIAAFNNVMQKFSTYFNKKNELYICAITNLIKKNNFLELAIELAEEQITPDFFEQEISNNPAKYVIDINQIVDIRDLQLVNEIVRELRKDLTVDEVAEMFSLDSSDILNIVGQIGK